MSLESNCTNPDSVVPSIVTHFDLHLEIFYSKLEKSSLFPIIWKDAPISKYHLDPNSLDTMHVINENSNSNCEAKALPAIDPEAFLFFFFCGQLVA